MFDDKGNGLFSTVLLDWIEWEGPLETDAEKSRRTGLVPSDDATPEVVAEHLQRFAERAWRRPVDKTELANIFNPTAPNVRRAKSRPKPIGWRCRAC